jgi:hypothetical protein
MTALAIISEDIRFRRSTAFDSRAMVNLRVAESTNRIYAYPMTAPRGYRPGWLDLILARGCTPQSCGSDHFENLAALDTAVFALEHTGNGLPAGDGRTSASAIWC